MADIVLKRGAVVMNDGVANGMRGTIAIGKKSWDTIERGDDYKWLRPDTYDCEFGWWTNSKEQKSKAIRVLGVYNNRVYIHPANKPSQLAGCIAPGNSLNSKGVGSSRAAMEGIFDALGGFKEGKKLTLEVKGQMLAIQGQCEPGDTGLPTLEDVNLLTLV